ncbi:MAG TPA: nucleotidyl transferase AbiEii/AbiGii toxin family protein [Dermatophilaceae bacterium]|nr:nucleotidyl transferase AbiEii/AbiGii toxin family protein [Dermatophilaceae bacterium]
MSHPIRETLAALNEAGVRYVVVGGVAVVLRGHPRMTVDLDLVLDLAGYNARLAVDTLLAIGLQARLPVDPADFANPTVRQGWVEGRHLVAFTMVDPADSTREVDLFADPPIPFADLDARADWLNLGDVAVRVASIEDLVTM